MKTNSSPTRDAQGSVLVITLSVVAVAAIVLASYLLIVQAQTASVARSQSWNTLISVSEAGAEEGMSLINKGAPAILPSGLLWTNGAVADGWTVSGGIYTMTRTLYNNNSYTVTVDITGSLSPYPVITCTATVPYNSIPWVFSSAGGPFLATGGVITGNGAPSNSTVTVGRKVQVQTVPSPLFTAAVVTKLNFDLNGNGTTVDSFDSSTSVYSTGGLYDSTKRKSNGTIATDSSIVGDISIGQGNIYGHVYTGPNTAQTAVQVGNNGAVGDAAWQASGGTGIEPGYWKGDFNMNIPDVPTPTFSGGALPAAVGGVINVNGGNYTVTSVGSPLNITGPTTLWVQGSFGQGVTIATTNNASLVLFVGQASGTGDSVAMGGNGFH